MKFGLKDLQTKNMLQSMPSLTEIPKFLFLGLGFCELNYWSYFSGTLSPQKENPGWTRSNCNRPSSTGTGHGI